MPSPRLTVALSQSQSQNPAHRALEEEIAAALIMEPGIEISIVPHLYDLSDKHTGLLYLQSVKGDMVVLAWMFPRAAHWELDRAGVKGRIGTVLLEKEDADADDSEDDEREPEEKKETIGAVNVPDRHIYCLDLRDFETAEPFITEIRRIAAETRVEMVPIQLGGLAATPPAPTAPAEVSVSAPPQAPIAEPNLTQWIQGEAKPEQLSRYFEPKKFLDPTARRWHPVIDYSRCTNCMECIDFCLFGVYGVDSAERILIEQPDNCKKGCPACSRVCPEHAIIFPMHKTPEIAGAAGSGPGGLKIDLSKLFGGPSAFEIAAMERDNELVRDGREAVGLSVGIPKRQSGKPTQPKDDLDKLIDQLDELEI